MEKAKIMLLLIGILAVVGGTLAFKANTKRSQDFCILSTFPDPLTRWCTGFFGLSKTTLKVQPGVTYYYTVTNNTTNCSNGVVRCNSSTKLTFD